MTQGKLIQAHLPADYSDCCEKTIDAAHPTSVDRLFSSMFGHFPWPLRMLLSLRDALVKPLGLKTGTTFRDRIIARSEEEIILGATDKHLSFWVSVYCSAPSGGKQTAAVSTVIKYRNRLGRIYFAAIWVFHKLIVRSLLLKAIHNSQKINL